MLQNDPTGNAAAAVSSQTPEGNSSLSLLPWSVLGPDPAGAPLQSISAACQSLFAVTEKLGARACCLVASQMENATPQWVCQLLQPLARIGFRSGGALLRAAQAAGPAEQQHSLSAHAMFVRKENSQSTWAGRGRFAAAGSEDPGNQSECQWRIGTDASTGIAGSGGRLRQPANLPGARRSAPLSANGLDEHELPDGARCWDPIFLEMERSAACWQRTRGSVSVPARGDYRVPVGRDGNTWT